jgi:hypothetical protein
MENPFKSPSRRKKRGRYCEHGCIIQLGEKASLADVLEPLAQGYGTELILPTGEITDTLLFEMVGPSAFAVSRLGEGQSRSALPL